MKIVKPSDIIFLKEFTSLKKISNGEALPSSYYNITEPQNTFAYGLTSNVIKLSDTLELQVGEEIQVKDENSLFKKNIITAKSGKIEGMGYFFYQYELLNDIDAVYISPDVAAVEIQQINKKIVFNALPEDEYYIIPTNEKLVCRSTFASIHIDYSDFVTFYPDSKNYNEFEHEKLNKVALSDVYADLSGYQDFYNVIHFASLEQIVRLKMMCLITNRFASQNAQIQEETPCRKYEKALNSFIVSLKLVNNSDNTPSGQAPRTSFAGSYSL
jgi:hypothetical protein